jgi:hypothetical protein
MSPFIRRRTLHICIIKLTLRDKTERLSVQIVTMGITRSKQQTGFTHVSW